MLFGYRTSCYAQARRRRAVMAHFRRKTRTEEPQFSRFLRRRIYIFYGAEFIYYSAQITNYSSSVFASHEAADPVEERREEGLESSKLPREMPRQATVFI